MSGEHHQDFLQDFVSRVMGVHDQHGHCSLPPEMIHDLDQRTAALRDEMRDHGIDPRDSKVAATMAFVCSTVMEITQDAQSEHLSDGCDYDGDCDVSSLLSNAYVQDFVALMGMVVRDSL